MTNDELTSATRLRRTRGMRVVGLLVALAAIAPAVGCRPPVFSSSPGTPAGPVAVLGDSRPGAPAAPGAPRAPGEPAGLAPDRVPSTEPPAALGRAGGSVPGGTTVFDDDVPGVANLDP